MKPQPLMVTIAQYVILVSVSATLFSLVEGRSMGDSLWWSVVTAMTVGYGDISPVTIWGRLLGVIEMTVVPLYIIPKIVADVLAAVIKDEHKFTHDEQEEILAYVRRNQGKA